MFLREHPVWKDVLAFDQFNARVVIRKRPYWGDEEPDVSWTDHHESLVRVWFQDEDIAATQSDVGRAVQAAARNNLVHPVRSFLDSLAWDGKARIDSWLIDYMHADDSPYARAISSRYLISAVARIYQPGCKVDHMLVLEGPQGKQKSEALRTLAVRDAWFTDRLSHVSSKDAAQELAGVWLIEWAEMEALLRATSTSTKSFITRRYDRYRPPYGKHPINLPRSCVFAGTINPVVGGYLKDPTGARPESRRHRTACCFKDWLLPDTEQALAEASFEPHLLAARNGGWMPKSWASPATEQAARSRWMSGGSPSRSGSVTVRTPASTKCSSARLALNHAQNRSAEMRVAAILTQIGFSKHRPRKGNVRKNRYWRD